MELDGFKKYLIQQIEGYFEDNAGIYITDEPFRDDEGNEIVIDTEAIADRIINSISNRILTFKTTVGFNETFAGKYKPGSLICPECYRPHGEWQSLTGGQVNINQILKENISIILVDDF